MRKNIFKLIFPWVKKENKLFNIKGSSLQYKPFYFFSTLQSLKFGVNPMKKTQIFSLTNHQISQLSSISHYVTSIQYLQQNNFLNEAKNKFPESINLQMCLLNRISILLKLLHRLTEFVETLQQIFFLCFSFKGARSLDTEKNLENYLLGLTYHNLNKLHLFLQFISQNPDFNKIKLKNIQFYRVMTQVILKNGTQQSVLKLNSLPEDTAWQKCFKYNNMSWLKYVRIKKNQTTQQAISKILKKQGQVILKNYIISLLEIQSKNSNQMRKITETQMKNNLIFHHQLQTYLEGKIQVLRVSPLKLIHPQSHVICMNIAILLFQSERYEQATIFMKISLDTALDLNQLHRVGFCLILLSRMNYKCGNDWEQILLSMLQNIERYPKQIAKQCLLTYSKFLFKEGRFVEAQNYENQAQQIQGDLYLEGMLLPQYDFSF